MGKTPERTETNVANIFAGTVVTDQSISQKKQEEKTDQSMSTRFYREMPRSETQIYKNRQKFTKGIQL